MNIPTLRVAGALGASALLLTGCMQGGQSETEVDASAFQDPTVGEVPEGTLEGTTMTFVSWGGEYQDGQVAAFSDPFSQTTGAELLSDGPTDVAKLQAQVESGNVSWDVINASPTINAANCGTLFEELDMSLIDDSKIPEGFPRGECFLPSMSYVYGFFYDAETYGDNPPTGWEDFFDTEGFPGVRAIDGRTTPTAGTYEAALLAEGVAADDLYPLDTARAIEKYSSIEDSLAFWTSGAEQTQMIQGGEADMVFGWSGRIFEANQNGADFRPVWDESFLASDSFSIAKGTPNLVAAHAYINYALGEVQQTEMAEATSYSPANVDSRPAFSPEASEFDVSRPEVLERTIPQNAEYWGENLDELSEEWNRFLNS